jgi:hypothetical protein
VATLDPDEQAALVKSYEPKPGTDGYADAAKRQDVLAKAIDQANKEKQQDPASFAINRLAASGDAYKAFSDATGADDATRSAAARKYAATTLMEQGHVGIPSEMQQILPQGYADGFTKQIQKAADSDDPQARVGLIDQVQREAAMWGEHWPQVMGQLAPNTQPIVRAIAAGADPVAMTRLLSLGKDENPQQLLKEQSETKANDLTIAVNSEMAPFLRTLVGRQRDRDYTGYYNLAQKLGALYVRDGKSGSDAARDAFTALIGNRYDFRDTYRIPKSAGVSADDVQAGAQAARSGIGSGEIGVTPAINDVGVSDVAADSRQKFARDGKWVTSPDNSGLNLAYGDKFVRRADGKPLLMSWSQLGDLAKRNRAAADADLQGAPVMP